MRIALALLLVFSCCCVGWRSRGGACREPQNHAQADMSGGPSKQCEPRR